MNRLTAITSAVVILLLCCVFSWRAGWSSHADHINALAAEKKEKAEKTIQPVEQKGRSRCRRGQGHLQNHNSRRGEICSVSESYCVQV